MPYISNPANTMGQTSRVIARRYVADIEGEREGRREGEREGRREGEREGRREG